MDDEKNAAQEVSPLVDYLIQEERAHGRTSREIFKASDLRDSLVRKSSESMVLKSKNDKGRETVKGKAKVRYEANNVFSVSEVRAFDGRFSGDALYTPGQDAEWNWGDFPASVTPKDRLLARLRSLVEHLGSRTNRALTGEETSEVQAMLERMMTDYVALEKTKRLVKEIDRAQAQVDQEWAKELAMYTAKFEGGVSEGHQHD
jgi:hypothetical protein